MLRGVKCLLLQENIPQCPEGHPVKMVQECLTLAHVMHSRANFHEIFKWLRQFFIRVNILIWFQHISILREVADGLSCSHLVKSLILLLCSASYFQDEVRNLRNNFLLLIHNFDQVSEILQHLWNGGDKDSLVLCVCRTYSALWYFPKITLKQILKLCIWPGPGEWP